MWYFLICACHPEQKFSVHTSWFVRVIQTKILSAHFLIYACHPDQNSQCNNDLTVTSLEIIVSKGNHPQMALIQVEWNMIIYPDICTPFLGHATRLRFLDSHDGLGPDLRQRWNWPHRCFPKGKSHGMGPKKFDRFLLIHNYNAGPPR